jgi:hypothetical protein
MNWFRNYYRHCGKEWTDVWNAECDDDCPVCGKEITPYRSEDADPPPAASRAVAATWEMACPHCRRSDQLDVNAHVWVRLTADGTDADASDNGSHEWDDDDPCLCAACGWSGTVRGAQLDPAPRRIAHYQIWGHDVAWDGASVTCATCVVSEASARAIAFMVANKIHNVRVNGTEIVYSHTSVEGDPP